MRLRGGNGRAEGTGRAAPGSPPPWIGAELIELSAEGVWAIDTEGRTVYANSAMAAMLHTTPEAMLGRTFFDWMDEEGQRIGAQRMERWRQGIGERHESRFITDRGAELWTELTTSPGVVEGAVVGVVAWVHDITERRASARYLAELQQLTLRVASAVSFDEVAHACAEGILAAVGARSVVVRVADATGGRLRIAASAGPDSSARSLLQEIPLEGVVQRTFERREPLLLGSPEAFAIYPEHVSAAALEAGHGATAALPVMDGSEPLGSIGVGYREPR